MPSLNAANINDMVISTLRDLGPPRFQNIAQSLVDYEVMPKWFRKDKVVLESGYGVSRTLLNRTADSARHRGLLEEDTINLPEVLDQITVDWRHVDASWAFIYQEALMNRGRALIVSIIEPRRAASLLDLADELEDAAWTAPAVDDKKYPYGVPYWIVKNATTGFNGGYPGSHTTVGGVNLDDSPTFKNYTAIYTDVTKADLIKKMRTAHRKIRFKSPITIQDYRGGQGDRYRIYVNETTISAIEDVGEAQNENLGRDIAALDNTMVFRNHPVIYVAKLDADTTDPVYMIDHSVWMPVVLSGDYLRESQADRAPSQHNVFQFFVDLTYQYLCVDRRRNAVLATSA